MKMKKKGLVTIIAFFIILTIVASITLKVLNSRKTANNVISAKLAKMKSYDQVQEGDDATESNYVKFDSYFLFDVDGDGDDEKVRGTCNKITETVGLYMSCDVLGAGYVKDARIYVNNENFSFTPNYMNGIFPKDKLWHNTVTDYYDLEDIHSETHGKICVEVDSFGTYAFYYRHDQITPYNGLNDDINNYSKVNSVTFSGTYVVDNGDGTTTETPINKTVNLTVDWYDDIVCEINKEDQETDISLCIDNDEKKFNANVKIFAKATTGLILKKSYIEGVVPQLNGYNPLDVEITGTNISYTYDKNTRKFTAQREAVINENGVVTCGVRSDDIYNNYYVKIAYPLSAYANEDMLSLDIPVTAYYEAYNNSGEAFDNPCVSNVANENIKAMFVKVSDNDVVYENSLQNLSFINGEGINKTKTFNIYNGISSEENDDIYTSFWRIGIRTYSYKGLVFSENTPDRFIKEDGTEISMEDMYSYVGIKFTNYPSQMLGETGWIKVYDDTTGELIETFTKNNWKTNEPYYYSKPIKKIRMETSKIINDEKEALYLYIHNYKKLDNEKVVKTFDFNEFLGIKKLKTAMKFKALTDRYEFVDTYDVEGECKEPNAEIKISVNKEQISVENEIKNFEITVNANEKNIKWKDGIFDIKLPEEVIGLKINNVSIDNENIQISGVEICNENGCKHIKVVTKNDTPDVYSIKINSNITLNPKSASKESRIVVNGVNNYYKLLPITENDNLDISIKSPEEVLTSQVCTEFNESDNAIIAPKNVELSKDKRSAKITINATNNSKNAVNNVKILGRIPFEGNKNILNEEPNGSEFNTTIKNTGISVPSALQSSVKVYYSEVKNANKEIDDFSNNWTETPSDWSKVKCFLIDYQQKTMNIGEEDEFSYEINIPEGIEYGKMSYSVHAVYYDEPGEEVNERYIESSKLGLIISKKYDIELTKYQENTNKKIKGVTYSVLDNNGEGQSNISDENGKIDFSDLYVGIEYTLKEISTVEEYALSEEEVKFKLVEGENEELSLQIVSGNVRASELVKNADESYKLKIDVEDKARINLKVTQLDDSTEAVLKYEKYKITGKGKSDGGEIYTTDNNGVLSISGLYENEEYILKEEKIDDYYLDEPIKLKVTKENDDYVINILEGSVKSNNITIIDSIPTVEIVTEATKIPTYNLELTKIKKTSNVELGGGNSEEVTYLPNVKFYLYYNNKKIEEYTTDENGKFTINGLYQYDSNKDFNATYVLSEVEQLEGYTAVKDITFRVCDNGGNLEFQEEIQEGQTAKQYTAEGDTVKITVGDSPIFKLVKKDAETQELLPNAKFVIYNDEDGDEKPATNSKGEYVGELENIDGTEYYVVTTDSNGEALVDLPEGLYKAKEVKTSSDKYVLSNNVYYFGIGATAEAKALNYKFNFADDIGGIKDDSINSVAKTSDGGYIAGGAIQSNIEIGGYKLECKGKTDGILVKYNSNNVVKWAVSMGGVKGAKGIGYYSNGTYGAEIELPAETYISSVIETADEGYIVGGYSAVQELFVGKQKINLMGESDGIVAKFTKNGELEWIKNIGDIGSDTITKVDVLNDGGVIVGGYTTSSSISIGSYNLTANNKNGMLAKLSSNGNVEYAELLQNRINSVKGTEDGGYIVATEDNIFKYNSNNEVVWSKDIYNSAIVDIDTNGDILIASEYGGIVRYDNNGEEKNTITYNTVSAMCTTEDGGYITREYEYINKYDSTDNIEWTTEIDSDIGNFKSITELTNGDFVIGGEFYGEIEIDENQISTFEYREYGYNTKDGIVVRYKNLKRPQIEEQQELTVENEIRKLKITTDINEVNGVKGGSISGEDENPYEEVKYENNNTKEIVITPDEGYELSNIKINGNNHRFTVNPDGTYTMPVFTEVKENKHVVVTFIKSSNKVTINKVDQDTGENIEQEGVTFKVDQTEAEELNQNIVGALTDNGRVHYDGMSDLIKGDDSDYFISQDGKYIPNNYSDSSYSSIAHSYIKIDLSDKTDDYIVQLKAEKKTNINGTLWATISDNESSVSVTNSRRFMYITNVQSEAEYNSEVLKGGNIYYLHLCYSKSYDTSEESPVSINSIKLLNIASLSLAQNVINDNILNTIENNGTYYFAENSGKYISNNNNKGNQTAYSYIPIDLSGLEGNYAVIVNAEISSELRYDFGYATISQDTNAIKQSNSNNDFIYISGAQSARDYMSKYLAGGEKYYLHLSYSKDNRTNSGTDQMTINSVKVVKIQDVQETSSNIYNFVDNDGKYESTNMAVKNSTSNSYIPIDLRAYKGTYDITVNAKISSEQDVDYGYAQITEDTNRVSDSEDNKFIYISGDIDSTDYVAKVEGGKLYYLHLGYVKDDDTDYGDDKFIVNSVYVSLAEESYYHGNIITDSEGKANAELLYGKYTITEIVEPEGYAVSTNPVNINFSSSGTQHEFNIKNEKLEKIKVQHLLATKNGDGTYTYTDTKLADDEIIYGKLGEAYYAIPRIDIEKYDLIKNADNEDVYPANMEGTFTTEVQVVKFYYAKVEVPVIVHHYLNGTNIKVPSNNGGVVEDEYYYGEEDEEYTTNSSDQISNDYKLVVTPENANGHYKYPKTDVIYYYALKENEITTEVRNHEEIVDDVSVQVAGGTISGMGETPYERVGNGENSTKEIKIQSEEGYIIKSITIQNKYDTGIITNNDVFLTRDYKNYTLDKFVNMQSSKHIIVEFEKEPVTFTLVKKDEETGTLLPNTKFAIFDLLNNEKPAVDNWGKIIGDKEIIDEKEYYILTTNQNGELNVNLPKGMYKAVEVKASSNKYDLTNNEYYFNVGKIITVIDELWTEETNEVININSVKETKDRGYIIGGKFYGGLISEELTLSGHGSYDGCIIKYNSEKQIEYVTTLGGTADDEVSDVIETSDGGYLAVGYYSGSMQVGEETLTSQGDYDGFIIKYSESLEPEWAKSIGGTGTDMIRSIVQASDGGYIVAGSFENTMQIGEETLTSQGSYDGFIIKYSESFEPEWTKTIGGNGYQDIKSIIETKDGGYIICGNYYDSFEIDGQELQDDSNNNEFIIKLNSSKEIEKIVTLGADINSIKEIKKGGYVAVGSFSSQQIQLGDITYENENYDGYGSSSGIIIKYDEELNVEGVLVKDDIMNINSVSETADGNIIISNSNNEYSKYFIGLKVKENSAEYIKSDSLSLDEYTIEAVEGTSDGGYITAQRTPYTSSGTSSLLIKYNNNKEVEWEINNGTSLYIKSVSETSDLGYIVSGYFVNEIEIEGNVYSTTKNNCGIIIKYNYLGEVEWCKALSDETYSQIQKAKETPNGDIMIKGAFNQSLTIGDIELTGGSYESTSFIAKYDRNGSVISANTMSQMQYENTLFDVTSDGGYIIYTRGNDNNNYVEKYDISNNKKWENQISDDEGSLYSIVSTSDNGYIVYGYFYNGINIGGYESYHGKALIKYNKDNEIEWVKKINDGSITCVSKAANDGYILAKEYSFEKYVFDVEEIEKVELLVNNKLKQFDITTETKEIDGVKVGSISGEGDEPYEVVNHGDSNTKEIKVEAEEGYRINSIVVQSIDNNGKITKKNERINGIITEYTLNTLENIKTNKHIIADFVENSAEKPETSVLVHYYKEGTTESVSEDVTLIGRVDDPYETTEAELVDSKYELVSEPANKAGTMTEEQIVVTYYYRTKETSVLVHYYKEGTTEKLSEDVTLTGRVDDAYETTEAELVDSKYELVSEPANKAGTMTEEQIVVTYYYRTKETSVLVHYYKEGTTEKLSEDVTLTGRVDDAYETTEAELVDSKYELVSEPANKAGTMTEEQIVVTYYYRTKETSVLVHYYKEGTTEKLSEDVTLTGRVDDAYETTEAELVDAKYELVSEPANKAGIMTEEQIVVIYYYKLKDTSVLVHHYLEGTTTKLSEDVLIEGKADDEYTTTVAGDIDAKYELVSEPANKAGTMTAEQIIVTYYYKVKGASVLVHYYKEGTTEKVSEDVVIEGDVNDPYETTSAGDIDTKYELVSEPANKSGVMTEEQIVVTYYYRLKNTSVLVKYINKLTNEEIDVQELIEGKVDDPYETEQKVIDGFTFENSTNNTSGIMTEEQIVVNYYYRKNTTVRVQYIEKTTDEIIDEKIIPGLVGDTFEVTPEIPEGYTLLEEPEEKVKELTEEPVIFKYYIAANTKVIVKYLNKATEEKAIETEEIKGYEGKAYTAEPKTIKGYTYIETIGAISGNMTRNTIEIIHYYSKDTEVRVQYIEKSTDIIIKEDVISGAVGDTYEVRTEIPRGYTLLEEPKEKIKVLTEETTIFKYYIAANTKVVVKYLEKNTNNELVATEEIKGYEGKEYTTKEKFIENYTLSKVVGNASGKMSKNVSEVIYYYSQNTSARVQYIDKDTESILDERIAIGLVGDIFETVAKDFKNYILVEEPKQKTVAMEKEEIVLKYYYKKAESGVIEKHIDDITGDIIYNELHEGEEGKEYSIKERKFEGYELVKEKYPKNTTGIMTKYPIEVIFYYKKKAKVKIKYIDTITGKEIVEKELLEGYENDKYVTNEKKINGYDIVKEKYPENATGIMKVTQGKDGKLENETEVIYYYVHKSEGVEIKYVDSVTGEIIDIIKYEGHEGDPYEAKEKEIKGYDIDKDRYPNVTKGNMKIDKIEIVFYYKRQAKVEVQYIDKITEKLLDKEILKGNDQDKYTTEEKTFEDYDIVKEEYPENTKGKMDGNKVIVVKYYYVKSASVIVKHIDVDTGEEIAEREKIEGYEGCIYTTKEKDIKYYTLVKEKYPTNSKGKMPKGKTKVIYKYRKLEFNMKVDKWIDKVLVDGKKHKGNSIDDNKLVKIEILRKKIKEAEIKVVYKIRVTNDAELEGYVGKVEDIIPKGLIYKAEDNKEYWKKDGEKLIADLSQKKIKAGKHVELELILTWDKNINNLDAKQNVVKIKDITNPAKYKETTTIDNKSKTDILITISTGQDKKTIIIQATLVTLSLISFGGAIALKRKVK